MHPAGTGAEQLTIKHMRQPCQRVPVTRLVGGKGPDDTIFGQAVQNVVIIIYVVVIVVFGKIKTGNLPEDQQGTQYQDKIRENDESFFHRFRHNS